MKEDFRMVFIIVRTIPYFIVYIQQWYKQYLTKTILRSVKNNIIPDILLSLGVQCINHNLHIYLFLSDPYKSETVNSPIQFSCLC